MLLNLRQHLFLSVALPLSLGLIVVTLAAIIPLYADVDDWNAQTSEAITSMVLGASATRLLKLHENLQGQSKDEHTQRVGHAWMLACVPCAAAALRCRGLPRAPVVPFC